MRKMIKTINAILSTINITILFIIVLCVTWQVMARFIFKSPSIITDELSRLLFICLGLLGGAYTAGQNRHLAIDLLPMSLTGKPKQILFMVIQTIVLLFSLIIMVYGGGILALDTFESGQTSPALGWQMGYIYLCIPISGLLIIIYTISLVMEELKASVPATDTINK
ncbi:TRAP transporter small permease [Klebsiella pasteurii]|uniref:TRAP transporter small permease n=1 Tax=Klebsiella pasteurii TaxID=2587529 RepID=UPI00237AF342|nr:TRAP transporter small permease [Klebsiella pasteurii]MDD9651727.1 TRAP transporter small permease [Klebsiella pasteurii]